MFHNSNVSILTECWKCSPLAWIYTWTLWRQQFNHLSYCCRSPLPMSDPPPVKPYRYQLDSSKAPEPIHFVLPGYLSGEILGSAWRRGLKMRHPRSLPCCRWHIPPVIWLALLLPYFTDEAVATRYLQERFVFDIGNDTRFYCRMQLTLRRRIKSHLLFAGIIRSSPFSPR